MNFENELIKWFYLLNEKHTAPYHCIAVGTNQQWWCHSLFKDAWKSQTSVPSEGDALAPTYTDIEQVYSVVWTLARIRSNCMKSSNWIVFGNWCIFRFKYCLPLGLSNNERNAFTSFKQKERNKREDKYIKTRKRMNERKNQKLVELLWKWNG